MDTIALAHDAAKPLDKYPRAQQSQHCVGCGEAMRDCECRGCNCAACATKQELQQAELECGGCHHKKKDCSCSQSQSGHGVTISKPAASSTATQTAKETNTMP